MAPSPKLPPPLNIPFSSSVVHVSIIDTTSRIKGIPFSLMMVPEYKGLDYLNCPAFSFLIEHPVSGRKYLFDLGVRQDWQNGPRTIVERIKNGGWQVTVEKGVADILLDGGIDPNEIEGIIWSHHHWDHTGDPATFPFSTDLIVGPGFKSAFVPGFPSNPDAPISESAYKGRQFREISFKDSELLLGNFKAFDFFGDGSFYLLDSPGHAIGHICALCRTTASPNPTFIFLGGDCAHHGCEIRPTPYLPLPSSIDPSPVPRFHPSNCPGSVFAAVHRLHPSEEASIQPFVLANENAAHDVTAARESVRKLGEFDGHSNVLTMLAHDDSMTDIVGLFPHSSANEWQELAWREKGLWRFLKDLDGAIDGKESA